MLMSQDIKKHLLKTKDGEGFFLFEHGGHETSASDAHSGSPPKSTLDLGDIQGIILLSYKMPMVRHFLLAVGVPAEARKMLGRLVSCRAGLKTENVGNGVGLLHLNRIRAQAPCT
jgi:hypothetical protein